MVQPGINLQWIPKPSRIFIKWTTATYEKKQNISQLHDKKHGKHDPTSDLKTCGHISFEMISSNFSLDCIDLIYLRYMDLKVNFLKLSCKI